MSFFRFRLRQQEADEEAQHHDRRAHDSGGLCDVHRQHRSGACEHRRDESRGHKGHAGADHAAADIGGETATRAA